jgi:hypothetical protein
VQDVGTVAARTTLRVERIHSLWSSVDYSSLHVLSSNFARTRSGVAHNNGPGTNGDVRVRSEKWRVWVVTKVLSMTSHHGLP